MWKILEGLLFHFDKRRPFVFLQLQAARASSGNLQASDRRHEDAGPQPRPDGPSTSTRSRSSSKRAGGPWILGEAFSLADVSWLVIFERLRQADASTSFWAPGSAPRCHAYWEQLKARPAYREAIVEQSHPLITYGTRRIQEAKAGNPELRELLEGA